MHEETKNRFCICWDLIIFYLWNVFYWIQQYFNLKFLTIFKNGDLIISGSGSFWYVFWLLQSVIILYFKDNLNRYIKKLCRMSYYWCILVDITFVLATIWLKYYRFGDKHQSINQFKMGYLGKVRWVWARRNIYLWQLQPTDTQKMLMHRVLQHT